MRIQPTVVLNVVGLSGSLLAWAPRIRALGPAVRLRPPLPAVTTTVQASMVTGLAPGSHGIVGNGWYDREACEVRFWQRSGRLVRGPKVWDVARERAGSREWGVGSREEGEAPPEGRGVAWGSLSRDCEGAVAAGDPATGAEGGDGARARLADARAPGSGRGAIRPLPSSHFPLPSSAPPTPHPQSAQRSFTTANLFWWYNSYSSCDYVVQARPIYKADGRKVPDCYTHPGDLRDRLTAELGPFPLFRFWGPMADITSSRWIAQAAMRTYDWHAPDLSLVYLPHLDYPLQKLGPGHAEVPGHVRAIDAVVGELIDYFRGKGVRPIVVSEYGIEPVDGAVFINRFLREKGLLAVREEEGLELLDPGASAAFAVADHQIAHVYLNDVRGLPRVDAEALAAELRDLPGGGVGEALGPADLPGAGLACDRSGDIVLVAAPGRWFTYDYWFDDRKAPDFARTVDIHRKPGYDPRELFSDKGKAAIAWKLLKRKAGFRQLLDVVPLDTSLVKGSHGRTDMPPELQPLLIAEAGLVEGVRGGGAAGGPGWPLLHSRGSDAPPPTLDAGLRTLDAPPLPSTAVRDVILRSLFRGGA